MLNIKHLFFNRNKEVKPVVCNPKIIFLDIDGVIKPCASLKFRQHDYKNIGKELSKTYRKNYRRYAIEDLALVLYDWDEQSIGCLRQIIERTGAGIVVTSSWKYHRLGLERMVDFFRLHGMENNITDITPDLIGEEYSRYESRIKEISAYLKDHPEIKNYVVVDDTDMKDAFKDHFLMTRHLLCKKDIAKAIEILEN
ncbi:MAG: hypothetical protein LBR08_02245 [Bacteroidales bacterium]|jgi:hypothetical protein|nr:hypothetical protein [Bacteroidales bacterium]